MEETVWIAIGVVIALLAIGMVVGVMRQGIGEQAIERAKQGVDNVASLCQKVCRMPDETYLSEAVTLPRGSVLTIADRSICVRIEDTQYCNTCDCTLFPSTLNLTQGSVFFSSHEYRCFLLKRGAINITCSG